MDINSRNIDLRSYTVTLPSPEMFKVLESTQLGDDVFSEDPTVNNLQKKAAIMMGKEDALIVPSGTMGNLVSILVHCSRGDEVILGDQAHTFLYEAGGISAFGGIHSRQLKNNDDGTIDIDKIKSAIREENVHFPPTTLICLENTHNRCFGAPLTVGYMKEVSDIAKENRCKVHLDGARIFNAAVALRVNVKELTQDVHSITFCLSKGLSAPVGSVICGCEEFIYHARRNRKALGGGMRQAGIIAAAGIVSLEKMISQIQDDHENAQQLAKGISQIKGLSVDKEKVKTNIIYFELESSKLTGSDIVDKMKNRGVNFLRLVPIDFVW